MGEGDPTAPERSTGYTTAELIEAFKDKLDPEDDLPYMEEMLPDEAMEYLLQALLTYGEEDPEAIVIERGFAQGFKDNNPEMKEVTSRLSREGKPFTTAEADALIKPGE